MKPQRKLCCVLAVGFIVLFFWCIGLYWGNVLCNQVTMGFLSSNISMEDPPKELKVLTPTSHYPGTLSCYFGQSDFFASRQVGIIRFIETLKRKPKQEFPSLYMDDSHWIDFVYDDMTKQILVRRTEKRGDKETQEIIGYIGPKGYSASRNSALGSFERPLLMPPSGDHAKNISYFSLFFYEPAACRFYLIEMDAERKIVAKKAYFTIAMDSIKVVEGPVQKQLDWAPVQIDSRLYEISDEGPYSNEGLYMGGLNIRWSPPYKVIRQFRDSYADQYAGVDPNTMPDSEATKEKIIPLENEPQMQSLKKDFFVLHQNGRIDYLDGKTLSVARCAGYLPEVGFYKNSVSRRPRDMADYEAFGFYDPNGVYLGTVTAAVSRDGVMMAMDFYDAKGILSAHESFRTNIRYSGKSINYYVSGIQLIKNISNGPLLLTVRYLLENLQPPLLRLLDLPAASFINPINQYSTLFVRPASLIGLMKIEFGRFGFWTQLLFLMLPSLAVSLWLGVKARRKAALLGCDTLAKDAWFIAILAFGIPAYITFKLMLPKERMITCANCGNPRRVEFDICQSCKRDWQKTKTLTTPPDWSVRNLAKTAADNPPVSEGVRRE